MAGTLVQCRELCTDAEFNVVRRSVKGEISALTRPRLKAYIVRARTLWDKYRELARRQSRDAKTRTGIAQSDRGSIPVRTDRKARLFAEALARFERRLQQLESTAQAGGRSSRVGKPGKKAGSGRLAATGGSSLKAGLKRQTQKAPRVRSIRGHVRAAVGRRQAKRDAR